MDVFDPFVLVARGGESFVVVAIIAVLAIGLTMRLLAGAIDHQRIRSYIHERGGRTGSIHWSPFGRGWFGDKHNRIYEVAYQDADGQLHAATCKTSFWSGVYWTEDRILPGSIAAPKTAGGDFRFLDDPTALAAENQRLHTELARLKRELKQRG
jgi:hypothetical protein